MTSDAEMAGLSDSRDRFRLSIWCHDVRSRCVRQQVSGSMAGSSASSTPSTSSRQYTRQRITRVNLRDLIFYMEQERETTHSLLLYRALLK